jgi:zeta-carotene desaturase
VGIIGSGLAGMITAMELAEAGHSVQIFDSRRFYGGKVGSWVDKDNNHIEMGLHVFFGCYYNLFGIMKRIGALQVPALSVLSWLAMRSSYSCEVLVELAA